MSWWSLGGKPHDVDACVCTYEHAYTVSELGYVCVFMGVQLRIYLHSAVCVCEKERDGVANPQERGLM